MKREILYSIPSTYRDEFRIQGFHFGDEEGEKSIAIVGAMRGDEIQQQYVCARLVDILKQIERKGQITPGCKITIIPSCNPFSMNVSRRFWPMDNTDINRMFPGYNQGETTQQIASAIFKHLEGYKYGIQMASFYIPGEFVPHVRMLQTGYEDIEGAGLFGFPYVSIRKPLPFDTTLLNYNWQLWDTKAYSIYAGQTDVIDIPGAQMVVESILRFLYRTSLITTKPLKDGYSSTLIDEKELINIKSQVAGIFHKLHSAGDVVRKGELIAEIIDPLDGSIIEEIKSPCFGEIFFAHNKPLVLQAATIFRIHGQ